MVMVVSGVKLSSISSSTWPAGWSMMPLFTISLRVEYCRYTCLLRTCGGGRGRGSEAEG
jgi:hypothetical protein